MKHALVITCVLILGACGVGQKASESSTTGLQESMGTTAPSPPGELVISVVKSTSQGQAIAVGETAVVHYTGWLYDPKRPEHKGTKFDSSRDRNEPFDFPVGGGQVIQGWDKGVAGMKVGEQRQLVIPPSMGYGARGAGGVISPNATLVFDVELLEIR